jgi:hypothetical protein
MAIANVEIKNINRAKMFLVAITFLIKKNNEAMYAKIVRIPPN